jgi:uncharacterized protein (TIGR02453 family)
MSALKKILTMEAPPYLRPEALKFLRGLARNNNRDWFLPRKEIFETEIKAPMLAITRSVTNAMLDFAPDHVRPAEKSILRIYRDTRFSADKSPYKSQVAAWWSRAGLEKTSGGGFYFHVSAKEVTIAAGVYMPEREQLLRIRTWLLDHHDEVRKLLKDRKMRKCFSELDGLMLTRPPKGFPKEHPAMDLILYRQWGVAASLPVEAALEKSFAKVIADHFRLAAPLVEALNTPLVAALKVGRKPLF